MNNRRVTDQSLQCARISYISIGRMLFCFSAMHMNIWTYCIASECSNNMLEISYKEKKKWKWKFSVCSWLNGTHRSTLWQTLCTPFEVHKFQCNIVCTQTETSGEFLVRILLTFVSLMYWQQNKLINHTRKIVRLFCFFFLYLRIRHTWN